MRPTGNVQTHFCALPIGTDDHNAVGHSADMQARQGFLNERELQHRSSLFTEHERVFFDNAGDGSPQSNPGLLQFIIA